MSVTFLLHILFFPSLDVKEINLTSSSGDLRMHYCVPWSMYILNYSVLYALLCSIVNAYILCYYITTPPNYSFMGLVPRGMLDLPRYILMYFKCLAAELQFPYSCFFFLQELHLLFKSLMMMTVS